MWSLPSGTYPPSIKDCHSGRADAVQAVVVWGRCLYTMAHRACGEQQMQGQTDTRLQLQGQQCSEVTQGCLSLPWLLGPMPKYRDVSGQASMAGKPHTAQLTVAGLSANTHGFSPELFHSRILIYFRLVHPWQQGPRPTPGPRGTTMPACLAASPRDTRVARFCWAVLFQPLELVQAGRPLRGLGCASLCGSVSLVHEASQLLLGSTFPASRFVDPNLPFMAAHPQWWEPCPKRSSEI